MDANEVRQLALPLTFSTRAFCWIRGAPSTTFACSEQVRARSGRNSRSSPSRSRAFSEFQLCGHAAPPFRPREPPVAAVAGSLQAASRARCGPDWRAAIDLRLIVALCGPLRWSCGQRIGRSCRHDTAMQGLFCSWCRIGQVMQARRPPAKHAALSAASRSSVRNGGCCVLRAACCGRRGCVLQAARDDLDAVFTH